MPDGNSLVSLEDMNLNARKSLRKCEYLLNRAVRFSHRNTWKIIIAFSLFIVSMLSFAPGLKKTVSLEDQLDAHLPSYHDLKKFKRIFGGDDALALFLLPQNGVSFTNREVCDFLLKMNEVVHSTPRVSDFDHALKIRKAHYDGQSLYYPYALTQPCTARPDEQFVYTGLEQSPWQGSLISEKSMDFGFVFGIPKLLERGETGYFDASLVKEVVEKIEQSISQKHYWSGAPAQQHFGALALDKSNLLNVITVLVIWFFLRACLGTWKAGFLYLCSLMMTISVLYGGMALFGHSIDPLSVSLFLIIAVACLEDFIFVSIDHLQRQPKDVHGNLRCFNRLVTGSFFTSFTTMIGFGSLMISPVDSIQRFGFWTMMGTLFEWALVFFLWPACAGKWAYFRDWTNPRKTWGRSFFKKSLQWVPPKKFTLVLLVAFIYPFFVHQDFKLSQTPTDLFPKGHQYQQALEYLTGTRQWVADASLVLNAEISSETRKHVLQMMESDELVAKIESFDLVHDFMTQDLPRDGLKEWVDHELKLTQVGEQYKAKSGEERVRVFLKSTDTEILNNLRQKIGSACPEGECFFTGEYVAYADYSNQLIRTLFESLFVSLILVGLVLFFLCLAKGSDEFWPIVISSFWSPAVLLCLIQIFQINITLVTCIVASLLVGLTGDNAIQYLFAGSKELSRGIENKGEGSIQCALTMSLASLVLLASPFDPPRSLGWILALGFVIALFGDLWILKGLLSLKGSLRFKRFFREARVK